MVGSLQEELDELMEHKSDELMMRGLDELRKLQGDLKQAKKRHREVTMALKNLEDEEQDTSAARRRRSKLHRSRTPLAQAASVHYPELLVTEPLLRIGGPNGLQGEEELRALLVEREKGHYEQETLLSRLEARHEVWRSSYDGEECVLKEFKLDGPAGWKALVKEVRLLKQLSDCPYVAGVQAVFWQVQSFVTSKEHVFWLVQLSWKYMQSLLHFARVCGYGTRCMVHSMKVEWCVF